MQAAMYRTLAELRIAYKKIFLATCRRSFAWEFPWGDRRPSSGIGGRGNLGRG